MHVDTLHSKVLKVKKMSRSDEKIVKKNILRTCFTKFHDFSMIFGKKINSMTFQGLFHDIIFFQVFHDFSMIFEPCFILLSLCSLKHDATWHLCKH